MKVVERRLRNLETRYQAVLESIQDDADPFSDQTIFNLLAAGEWEYVMKLLDCKKRGGRPAHLPPMPPVQRVLRFDSNNLTAVRQILDGSLGHLAPEQRYELAAALFDSGRQGTER